MSERKTLTFAPRTDDEETPLALKKKGRGWEISEKRLDAIHERARELRRYPTEAHKALAERFAKADWGKYVFKRHTVIGSAIVDFGCPNLGFAVVIDDGEPGVIETRRDRSLEAVGVQVMRLQASDILTDMPAVLRQLSDAINERIAAKQANRAARAPHTSRRPPARRNYDRTNDA